MVNIDSKYDSFIHFTMKFNLKDYSKSIFSGIFNSKKYSIIFFPGKFDSKYDSSIHFTIKFNSKDYSISFFFRNIQ